ncbi:MAG: thioredoxin family protein [Gemmatimonadales bacterium]
MTLDFRALWDQAMTFAEFMAASREHRGLWEGVRRLARIPDWARTPVPEGEQRHLLVLVEDWCGDASNTVPILARWAEEATGLDLKVLRRDEHPEVMDRYLTGSARSIPIVIVLDGEFEELGHWGPRPSELQAWVVAHKAEVPKGELYPQVRRWYAMDRGASTLREVMQVLGSDVRAA